MKLKLAFLIKKIISKILYQQLDHYNNHILKIIIQQHNIKLNTNFHYEICHLIKFKKYIMKISAFKN